MKTLIQCYKGAGQWINSPPGLGDFIRGTSHLHELLANSGVELRVDMSQSGFDQQFVPDAAIAHRGEASRIAQAQEYFEDHAALVVRIQAFLQSDETELYVCTNLGAWNRTTLPGGTIAYMRRFLQFQPQIHTAVDQAIPVAQYEVVSIRCGDAFYDAGQTPSHLHFMGHAQRLLETEILPRITHPLVLTSDSYELKYALAQRYGLLYLPHRSQHGAFNQTTLPVAIDLCLLSRSRFNHHINLWATWWSGFSHYTSLIFGIPSLNLRAPEFTCEVLGASGELSVA